MEKKTKKQKKNEETGEEVPFLFLVFSNYHHKKENNKINIDKLYNYGMMQYTFSPSLLPMVLILNGIEQKCS
jgi:hypothetical protein